MFGFAESFIFFTLAAVVSVFFCFFFFLGGGGGGVTLYVEYNEVLCNHV